MRMRGSEQYLAAKIHSQDLPRGSCIISINVRVFVLFVSTSSEIKSSVSVVEYLVP